LIDGSHHHHHHHDQFKPIGHIDEDEDNIPELLGPLTQQVEPAFPSSSVTATSSFSDATAAIMAATAATHTEQGQQQSVVVAASTGGGGGASANNSLSAAEGGGAAKSVSARHIPTVAGEGADEEKSAPKATNDSSNNDGSNCIHFQDFNDEINAAFDDNASDASNQGVADSSEALYFYDDDEDELVLDAEGNPVRSSSLGAVLGVQVREGEKEKHYPTGGMVSGLDYIIDDDNNNNDGANAAAADAGYVMAATSAAVASIDVDPSATSRAADPCTFDASPAPSSSPVEGAEFLMQQPPLPLPLPQPLPPPPPVTGFPVADVIDALPSASAAVAVATTTIATADNEKDATSLPPEGKTSQSDSNDSNNDDNDNTNNNNNINSDSDFTPTIATQAEAAAAIVPTDFGEQLIRNTNTASQFENVNGFSGIFVQNSMTIQEMKILLTNKLIEIKKLPEGTSPHRIRIREKVGVNPGRILTGGRSFAENQIYLYDHKTLAFQILPEAEELPEFQPGDVVIHVQRWHRATWTLGERLEVLLRGGLSVRDIARGLSALMQIPLEHLLAMVVPKETEILLSELAQTAPKQNYGRAWFDPAKERRLLRVMTHDMRVQDGDVLLLQDKSEPLRELTPADLKSIEIVAAAQQDPYLDFWSSSDHASSSSAASATAAAVAGGGGSSGSIYTNSNAYTMVSSTDNASSGSSSGIGIRGGNASGIHIKTHRERLLEQEEKERARQTQSTIGAATSPSSVTGNDGEEGVTLEGGTELRNTWDDPEFDLQGGLALFDDLQ